MDVETRLQQVATVINQIDDPKVPRNIRRQAKEACDQWLPTRVKTRRQDCDESVKVGRIVRRSKHSSRVGYSHSND